MPGTCPAKGAVNGDGKGDEKGDANGEVGAPGNDGICGTENGAPVAPDGAPSERHAFIQASIICCMPALGAAPLVPACVLSVEESVLGEAEECDAAMPAFTGKSLRTG